MLRHLLILPTVVLLALIPEGLGRTPRKDAARHNGWIDRAAAPSVPRPRAPAGRVGLRDAVCLLFIVIGAVVLLAQYLGTSASSRVEDPRATLIGEEVLTTADGSGMDVTLRLEAPDASLGPIRLHWLLAPLAQERPWEAPIFRSTVHEIDAIPAGESVRVRWSEIDPLVPRGRYQLSAWAHELGPDGEYTHLVGGMLAQVSFSEPRALEARLDASTFGEPGGPLVLESVSFTQPAPLAQEATAEVVVANTSDAPVAGRAYWLIGRLGDPEPWQSPPWQTEWMELPAIAPGERRTVRWSSAIGLPAGTYATSVWVHAAAESGWEHSHSSIPIPLELGHDASRVQRAGPPTTTFALTRMSPARPGHALIFVKNDADRAQDFSLLLRTLPEQRRYDWRQLERGDGNVIGPYRALARTAGTVEVPLPVDCTSGMTFTRVTAIIDSDGGTTTPIDDVLVEACR